MLVLLASPRWLWFPGKYLLVSYSMIFCMEPEHIRQDISATWEKLIKPTYRAHLFHQVSCTLIRYHSYLLSFNKWKILCRFRLFSCLNLFLQMLHSWGLSPVWTLSCLLRLPSVVKCLWHNRHSNGLSPVWVLMWVSKFLRCWEKAPHIVHCKGSPVSWMSRFRRSLWKREANS